MTGQLIDSNAPNLPDFNHKSIYLHCGEQAKCPKWKGDSGFIADKCASSADQGTEGEWMTTGSPTGAGPHTGTMPRGDNT